MKIHKMSGNTMKHLKILIGLTLLGSNELYAQTDSNINLEISPAYFFMGGYGIDVLANYQAHHGVGLSFSQAELPYDLSKLFFSDIDKQDEVTWRLPYSIQYRYYFSGYQGNGPLIGLALGKEKWKIKNRKEESQAENHLTSFFLSYKRNLSDGLYLSPTLFILLNTKIKGDDEYSLRKTAFAANISMGYRF